MNGKLCVYEMELSAESQLTSLAQCQEKIPDESLKNSNTINITVLYFAPKANMA